MRIFITTFKFLLVVLPETPPSSGQIVYAVSNLQSLYPNWFSSNENKAEQMTGNKHNVALSLWKKSSKMYLTVLITNFPLELFIISHLKQHY